MKVFLGGSWHLKAFPGVCWAPINQLSPCYTVLAWNADLPVSINQKLGASILQGYAREEQVMRMKERLACLSTSKETVMFPYQWVKLRQRPDARSRNMAPDYIWQQWLLEGRDFPWHGWKQVPSPVLTKWSNKAFMRVSLKTTAHSVSGRVLFWSHKLWWE